MMLKQTHHRSENVFSPLKTVEAYNYSSSPNRHAPRRKLNSFENIHKPINDSYAIARARQSISASQKTRNSIGKFTSPSDPLSLSHKSSSTAASLSQKHSHFDSNSGKKSNQSPDEEEDESRRHFFKLKLNALPTLKDWSDSDEEMETVRIKQSIVHAHFSSPLKLNLNTPASPSKKTLPPLDHKTAGLMTPQPKKHSLKKRDLHDLAQDEDDDDHYQLLKMKLEKKNYENIKCFTFMEKSGKKVNVMLNGVEEASPYLEDLPDSTNE